MMRWLALLLLGPSTGAWAQQIVPPTIVDCPTPLYPEGVDAGPQRVTALLRVDETGTVVEVNELAGDPRFVAVIEPVAQSCTFTPATEDGQPITVDQPFAWDWAEPAVPVESLVGRIVTRGDRLGVGGATVQVRRPDSDAILAVATTDETGAFTVMDLEPGPLRLDVLATGYRVPTQLLDGPQAADEQVEVELWAFRERDASNELVATYDPRTPGPTHRTLDREAIRAVPGSLGDPVRALLTQPGFARAPFEAGWLLVRGGDFDDTGLYLDGVRIPLLYHMGGFTSVLHPELTQAVDYWAGAQPARLQGTAGAVDVIPAEVGDRPRAVAGLNLAWAHGFVEVPTKFGGFAIAARRSYLDAVLAVALDPEAASIAPNFADVQGTLQIGDARFTALWLGDSLEVPSLDGGTLDVTQLGGQIQGRIPIDLPKGEVVIWPWLAQHGRGLIALDPAGVQVDQQALIERFPGVRAAWRSEPGADIRVETGFEAEYRMWTLQLDTRAFDAPGGRVDPWLQATTGDVVQFESGIRLDTLWVREQLPRAELSPRAAVRWNVSEDLSLHTEFGRFHGIPEVLLIAGLPEGAYLPLERSDLAAVGFRARRQAWTVEADVYSRQMAHLPGLELDGTLTQRLGLAYGVETQVGWRPDPLALTVLYQFGRSFRREELGGEPYSALTDQPHRLQLLAVAHLPRSWTLSSRFRYGSGFPRTIDPETGQFVPTEALDLLTQRTVPLDVSGDRLADYYALDVKILKEVQLRSWRLDFWLDVQNITNRRVVEPFLTGFPESSLTYGFGLPVLPIFGVEGVWWPGSKRRAEPEPD